MAASVTFNRKLSGTTFLAIRILLHVIVLIIGLKDIITDSKLIIPANLIFLASCLVDILICAGFLTLPHLTCTGNTYIKCLPFIMNTYVGNLFVFDIKLPSLLKLESPQHRIPQIAFYNIFSLLMYGGMACPLNLAWMETFKPFAKVALINRRFSQSQNARK